MNGMIAWFARNGVAANLLMVLIVAWGVLALTGIPIEVFPSMETQSITVNVPYLGAAPEEVEQGVCLRIEEAVQDLEGVDTIRSTAAEGSGTVVIELETDAGRKLESHYSGFDVVVHTAGDGTARNSALHGDTPSLLCNILLVGRHEPASSVHVLIPTSVSAFADLCHAALRVASAASREAC